MSCFVASIAGTAPVAVDITGGGDKNLLSLSTVECLFKSNPAVTSCRCKSNGQPNMVSSVTQLDEGWNTVTCEPSQPWGLPDEGSVECSCTNNIGEVGSGTAQIAIRSEYSHSMIDNVLLPSDIMMFYSLSILDIVSN